MMALFLNLQSPILFLSSLFMGIVFAYAASVQLNDPDWYFWFPLYALAAAINLLRLNFRWRAIAQSAMFVLCGGISLLIKVLVEAHLYGLCGFWSMDMRERVVREKIGSGLVAISMLCILIIAAASQEPLRERKAQDRNYVASGNATMVALTFAVSLYFCVCWTRYEFAMRETTVVKRRNIVSRRNIQISRVA